MSVPVYYLIFLKHVAERMIYHPVSSFVTPQVIPSAAQ